ncbi:glycosyltransferase family 2 protein [Bradyrhizobium genosp. P]|uniref:glycosyltransferase family 2 protein n=1 Tax=Bradyrhizobium genosp. P TaxID=83641 RepID=UPI003CF00F18
MSLRQISIGLLAHNEAIRLKATAETLFQQDIFQKFNIELVIVANGCTDSTVAVAQQLLSDYSGVWSQTGSARVEELTVAGKANAWNTFVHKLSSDQARILFLMDADIKILQRDTMSSMVTTLDRSSEAVVCVDRPIKDIELLSRRTLLQRLLIAAMPNLSASDVPLCGQLYCAYSVNLRPIWLPKAITGEDGFLRALLLTDGFTHPENPSRIVLDTKAAHIFESVQTAYELFKHEKWIVSSSIVNMILFERFWKEASSGLSAMTLMEMWTRLDSEWLPKYIAEQVHQRGWRLLPASWWGRRWLRLKGLSFAGKLRLLPVSALASLADAAVFVAAIRDVRKGRAFRYWGRT